MTLQGVKVYGVQSGHDTGATAFFSKMAEITLGHHVGLSDFSSIFDFLMMICYREGNPDMIPVRAVLYNKVKKYSQTGCYFRIFSYFFRTSDIFES